MENNLIKKIVGKKITCFFISPHLDDAALSCGGLISYLRGKTKVVVVNVFTCASPKPYTLSARIFLRKCGYEDADSFYNARKKEDNRVFKKIGVQVINLEFVDALWRKRKNINSVRKFLGKFIPELIHIYPIFLFDIAKGKVSKDDKFLIKDIKKKLISATSSKGDCVVFCSLATGNHTDHVIVRNICSKIFKNIVYWSDFPYNREFEDNFVFLKGKMVKPFSFTKHANERKKMIWGYKTQAENLFPDLNISLNSEKYFVQKSSQV